MLFFGVIVVVTVQEHIEKLQREHPDRNEEIVVAVWTVDDVKARAEERQLIITNEQAKAIIAAIDRRQDATIGITWDTVDAYLDNPHLCS